MSKGKPASGLAAVAAVVRNPASCSAPAAPKTWGACAAGRAAVIRATFALCRHAADATVRPERRCIHMTAVAAKGKHQKPLHEHVLQFPSYHDVQYETMYPPTRTVTDRGRIGEAPRPNEHWWLDNADKTGYVAPFKRPRKAPPVEDDIAVSKAKDWKSEFRVVHSEIIGKSDEELRAPLPKRIPEFDDSSFTANPQYTKNLLLQYRHKMSLLKYKYTRELAVLNQAREQEAARKEGRVGALINPEEAKDEVVGRFLPEGTKIKPTMRNEDILEPIDVKGLYDAWRSTAPNAVFKLSDGSIYRHDGMDDPVPATGSPWDKRRKTVTGTEASLIGRAGNPASDADEFRITPEGGDFVEIPKEVMKAGRLRNRLKHELQQSRMRVDILLQLYHEAENFVMEENLDAKIEEFYANVSHSDGVSLAELVLADEGTSKDFVPAKVVERPRVLVDFLEGTMLGGKLSSEGLAFTNGSIEVATKR